MSLDAALFRSEGLKIESSTVGKFTRKRAGEWNWNVNGSPAATAEARYQYRFCGCPRVWSSTLDTVKLFNRTFYDVRARKFARASTNVASASEELFGLLVQGERYVESPVDKLHKPSRLLIKV